MTNRYLQDNFAPVRSEVTVADLEVTGALPAHLDGRYLRIGPNPVTDPDPATYHWFVGDGMVHGVRLADGAARWYRNRYVRSAEVTAALGEPPRRVLAAARDFAANTNVVQYAGRTLALVEAGPTPYELDAELDTVGQCDFGGTLRGGYTAHPHEDPATGELHAVGYNWANGNHVEYTTVGTDGTVRRSVDIETTGSVMMHDFALTEHYAAFYDLPVTFDLERAMAGARLPYGWNPEYPARIGVLPRAGAATDVRWFEIDPCYVFHTLNAYEDGDTVVIDVIRHEKMFATELLGPNEGPATLARFTVDLAADKVTEDHVDARSQEFPRIDERLTGRRHRYGYTVGFAGAVPGDAVVRHDLVAGTSMVRALGAGREASEFCFVPSSAAGAEDDGVLMGYVYDRATDRSDLVLLDAQTLEDVAAVHLPVRVPAGFHGNWAPTDS